MQDRAVMVRVVSKINDGGQAFPSTLRQVGQGTFEVLTDSGMTLRDWFAGQALVGLLAEQSHPDCGGQSYCDLTESAYTLADIMLEVRDAK